jgi:hypothetical protein
MPNGQAKRVVSLIASATEIICALCARELRLSSLRKNVSIFGEFDIKKAR